MMTEAIRDEQEPGRNQNHALPLDIILFHMVDYGKIKSLPFNHDCTEILHTACIRVLERMFGDSSISVETFLPRHQEFQVLLEEELSAFKKGKWVPYSRSELKIRMSGQNDNSSQRKH